MAIDAGGVWKIGLVAAACVAIGVFVGQFAWRGYQVRVAEAQAAAASAAVAAEALTPRGRQREAVRRFMFDPQSAVFRNDAVSPRNPSVWCGEVNGRNRMGGLVGYSRYTVTLNAFPELSEFDQAMVEGPRGADGADGAVDFDQRHSLLCR